MKAVVVVDAPEQDGHPEPIRIDETWFQEWFERGWSGPDGLIDTLKKYAAFTDWDAANPRPPVEDDPALD